jgi:hypothetical protein
VHADVSVSGLLGNFATTYQLSKIALIQLGYQVIPEEDSVTELLSAEGARCSKPSDAVQACAAIQDEVRNLLSGNTVHSLGQKNMHKKTPWSESASELYRPSDRRMSAK